MNIALENTPDEMSSVLLISGFLGAGKTTLLKRILSWETDLSDTVVLVNEFGDVGIDGDLLKNSGSDVVELTSGCICCSLSVDLKQSLIRIWESYKPRRILIEASGVADPTAILPVLSDPPLSENMRLDKIVTVLDADVWEAREVFGKLFYNQLENAQLILLNKVDTAEKTTVSRYLEELHDIIPNCQVVPTVRCAVDPATLWSPVAARAISLKSMNAFRDLSLKDWEQPHEHNDENVQESRTPVSAGHFVTFSFENLKIVDEARFHQFVASLPVEIFRMKGPVRFSDRTEIINFVGGKGEWSPWEGDPGTRLAFIGWNVEQKQILEKLHACLL